MRIAVIGTGVVGLASAIRLRQDLNADVSVYFRDDLPSTTSSRAGAVFTPFDGGSNKPWILESLARFRDLAQTTPSSGVSIATALEYVAPSQPFPHWPALVGDVQPLPPLESTGPGFRVNVPFIDMTIYLPWLKAHAQNLGITFIHRGFTSLADLRSLRVDLIVNCAGLGARELVPDPFVRPMRGQLLHVENTLNLSQAIAAADLLGGVTYIYPFRTHIVLGGTYEPDISLCQTEPTTIEHILSRCKALLRATGHPDWQRLGERPIRTVAGLRPARIIDNRCETVRLELEPAPATSHTGPAIIHNYGHGRAGVTLSWGTAANVLELARALPHIR